MSVVFRRESEMDAADAKVSIVGLLRQAGVDCPDVQEGRSFKIRCPFGFTHSDGGVDPAFRVYGDSNSGYCFACTKFYTPVRLAAEMWDCRPAEAAHRLLEQIGEPFKVVYEAFSKEKTPDRESLSAALTVFCEGKAGQPSYDFPETVSAALGQCLNLVGSVGTAADARRWLDTCKAVMRQIIEREV